MGARHTKFDEERLAEMLATTSLNRTEIYHTFRQFRYIHELYQPSPDERKSPLFTEEGFNNPDASLPIDYVIDTIPVLKANPLSKRICEVFSQEKEGEMNFLEFLDMISAFNPKTSLPVRTVYAFRIYDMDGDGIISRTDLETVLDLFTDYEVKQSTKDVVINGIFREVNKKPNIDGLSSEDFNFAISRSPDFVSTFSFRI